MHGQAYGGKCLPKDMDQMIRLASDLGLQKPFLLTMVHALNETVRKGEFFE
jgi:UDP-glucose 6-dehydrogenase